MIIMTVQAKISLVAGGRLLITTAVVASLRNAFTLSKVLVTKTPSLYAVMMAQYSKSTANFVHSVT